MPVSHCLLFHVNMSVSLPFCLLFYNLFASQTGSVIYCLLSFVFYLLVFCCLPGTVSYFILESLSRCLSVCLLTSVNYQWRLPVSPSPSNGIQLILPTILSSSSIPRPICMGFLFSLVFPLLFRVSLFLSFLLFFLHFSFLFSRLSLLNFQWNP